MLRYATSDHSISGADFFVTAAIFFTNSTGTDRKVVQLLPTGSFS
jgi:hypothetical protein